MKKIITYLAFFAIAGFISCENEQEISASEVPQPVMSAFQSKYPNITADKWVKESEKGKTVYEAKFKNNNNWNTVTLIIFGNITLKTSGSIIFIIVNVLSFIFHDNMFSPRQTIQTKILLQKKIIIVCYCEYRLLFLIMKV